MAKFCTYCGRQVKPTDKFCTGCGKPLLSGGSARGKVPDLSVDSPSELPVETREGEAPAGTNDVEDGGVAGDGEPVDEGDGEGEKGGKKEKKKAKKGEKGGKVDRKPISPLSDADARQLEILCELAGIKDKKAKIRKKVEETEKLLKGDRVEWDDEYRQGIEVKLKALAQYSAPIKEKEAHLLAEKDDDFPLVALPPKIAQLKEQILELKRNTKFGKIKKDVYEELYAEYSTELKAAQQELSKLLIQVNVHINKKENEVNLKKREIRRIRARRKAGEIDEKAQEEKVAGLQKEIEKMEADVKTIKELVKKAKT
ncbi:MAG: zinc ribbon domain-containing protein [Promethearchaeota archaeon]